MTDEPDNVVGIWSRAKAASSAAPSAPGEVVAPKAFVTHLSAERLAELREQGALIQDASPIDELNLPEPAYGEQIMGDLTAEEAELFASYFAAHKEAERMNRGIGGGLLSKLGEAYRRGEEEQFLHGEGVSVEEAASFYRMQRRADYLKNLFYWVVGEKYGIHDFQIGVRTKRRIVKGKRKW